MVGRDVHIVGLHVKYPICFSEFHQNSNNSVIFKSIIILNFYRLLGFEMAHACSRNDGRTDGIRDLMSKCNFLIQRLRSRKQEANSHAARQETPKVSWNQKFTLASTRRRFMTQSLVKMNPFDTRPYHFAWQIEYLNSGVITFRAFPPGGPIYACIGQITRSQNPEGCNASLLILSFHQTLCVQIVPTLQLWRVNVYVDDNIK